VNAARALWDALLLFTFMFAYVVACIGIAFGAVWAWRRAPFGKTV
jgi:hypothetical protein